MKKLFTYGMVLTMSVALFFTSCKKDDPVQQPEPTGTIHLSIKPMVDAEPFEFKKEYKTEDNQRYSLTTLMYYLGDIKLIAEDGSTVPVTDIVLADFSETISPPYNANLIGTDFSFKVKTGKYKGIQYGLGVPENLNGIKNKTFNPAQYSNDHPLSAYRGTDWSWAGYIFFMMGGEHHTALDSIKTLEYHSATDSFYLPTHKDVSLEIKANETTHLPFVLNINKIFYTKAGDSNNINLDTESFTHSMGAVQKAIAHKIMHNLNEALNPEK